MVNQGYAQKRAVIGLKTSIACLRLWIRPAWGSSCSHSVSAHVSSRWLSRISTIVNKKGKFSSLHWCWPTVLLQQFFRKIYWNPLGSDKCWNDGLVFSLVTDTGLTVLCSTGMLRCGSWRIIHRYYSKYHPIIIDDLTHGTIPSEPDLELLRILNYG